MDDVLFLGGVLDGHKVITLRNPPDWFCLATDDGIDRYALQKRKPGEKYRVYVLEVIPATFECDSSNESIAATGQ